MAPPTLRTFVSDSQPVHCTSAFDPFSFRLACCCCCCCCCCCSTPAAGFVNNVLELAGGPGEYPTIVQGVQQSGDGSVCPPKDHTDWPCAAVRVSQNQGSTWSVAAVPRVTVDKKKGGVSGNSPFPLLPQSALNSKRAANRSNFSSISASHMCVNGSCCAGDNGCNIVQWSATAPLGATGIMMLRPEKISAMTVRGVPSNLRQGVDPGAPVMLRDGSVLLALYVSPFLPVFLHCLVGKVLPVFLNSSQSNSCCRGTPQTHKLIALDQRTGHCAPRFSSYPVLIQSGPPPTGSFCPRSTRYLRCSVMSPSTDRVSPRLCSFKMGASSQSFALKASTLTGERFPPMAVGHGASRLRPGHGRWLRTSCK
eukprot:SAG31_NODE_5616_length_2422_cov_20.727938_1_plen_366_part_00